MNKNEFELQRLSLDARNFDRALDFASFAVKWSVIAFLGYWFFDALKAMAAQHPASLDALARLVEKMNLSTVVHSMVTAGLGVAWAVERKGKKRAMHKLADFRRVVEADDPYQASSQLDRDGNTPTTT